MGKALMGLGGVVPASGAFTALFGNASVVQTVERDEEGRIRSTTLRRGRGGRADG